MANIVKSEGTSSLVVGDRLDAANLLSALGEKVENWKVEEAPPAHFHVPEEKTFVAGQIDRFFTYETTEYGAMEVVVLTVHASCKAIVTGTEDVVELVEGDEIGININRGGLKGKLTLQLGEDQSEWIGKKVIFICDGQTTTKKGNDFWKYRLLTSK